MNNLRDQALEYARRGWPVFPLVPRDKKPLVPRGVNEATTNPNIIERWWDRWPQANIGCATGESLGLWVLDVDGPDGSASLTKLETELGILPETLEQQTGRADGGRQLFFSWTKTREIRNKQDLRPGIDVRGNGGYVVLPPSIHPDTGVAYTWCEAGMDPRPAPPSWIDMLVPIQPTLPPWERVSPATRPRPRAENTVVERARAYLRACDPAVQGSGGHNALMWAARCMVLGFLLDDETALNLLWSDYNPRCAPPWNPDASADRKDFERKVGEARRIPFNKRDGWLLDEQGLRGVLTDAQVEAGRVSASALLEQAKTAALEGRSGVPTTSEPGGSLPADTDRREFPANLFPPQIEAYCRQVADAHGVDLSFVTLPVIVVAGAAMGNVWRLRLKKRFVVPPIIWGAIVAVTGSNKSGPLSEVTAPLQRPCPTDNVSPVSPGGKSYTGDVTIESLISLLRENPRGLLIYRDEIRAWIGSFDRYRKGSGADEQTWLEMWGGGPYQLNRKTDKEDVFIPSASVCVLGGIQPKILTDCFDPSKFASGLASRLLLTCPPETQRSWSDVEVDDEHIEMWARVVNWLRTRPFKSFRTQTISGSVEYDPRILSLTDEARDRFAEYTDDRGHEQFEISDENAKGLIAKSVGYAGRLALIHHALGLAVAGEPDFDRAVSLASMEAGIAWSQWFLEEQLRLYGYGYITYRREQAAYLSDLIRDRFPAKIVNARQIQRVNGRKYEKAKHALTAMRQLVAAGGAVWVDDRKTKIKLVEEGSLM